MASERLRPSTMKPPGLRRLCLKSARRKPDGLSARRRKPKTMPASRKCARTMKGCRNMQKPLPCVKKVSVIAVSLTILTQCTSHRAVAIKPPQHQPLRADLLVPEPAPRPKLKSGDHSKLKLQEALAYGDANARGLIQGRKNVEAAEA